MSTVDRDTVKAMFPEAVSSNIDANFREIDAAFDRQIALLEADQRHGQSLSIEEKTQLALFMYATVRAENANFTAQSESINPTNSFAFNHVKAHFDDHGCLKRLGFAAELIKPTSEYSLLGQAFGLYETGARQKSLGNHFGDGAKFKGRGYVQLTGRSNYRRYSKVVPGLEIHPSLADDKRNAAKILVAYILDHRHMILQSLSQGNLSAARSVVNGKPKPGRQPNGLNLFVVAYKKGQDHLANKAASASLARTKPGTARAGDLRLKR